jgi:hypothetical protein
MTLKAEITTNLFACASSALIDRRTNALSLIGVYEEINTPSLPLVLPELSIVWLTRRSSPSIVNFDAELEIKLNAKVMGTYPLKVNFGDQNNFRSIAIFGGFVITDPGVLEISVKQPGTKKKKLASAIIPIVLLSGNTSPELSN